MVALFPSRTVALELFGFSVHWYGLLYVFAFLLAYLLLPRLQRERRLALTMEEWSEILAWGIVGVLVGGRLGYVLFYQPMHFLSSPLEVFAVWRGGMSSHGGFLGVGIAIFSVARKRGIPLLALLDLLVIPAAIGLALGRLGNLINQELYGTVTLLPWGIAVPGVSGLRHPVQLYAALKDISIAFVCLLHLRRMRNGQPGGTFTLFLILYGILRFLLEGVRAQEYPPLHFGVVALTRGQFLTLPLLLLALALALWRWRVWREVARQVAP